jgi:transposase
VLAKRLWLRLVGVEGAVVEDVDWDEEEGAVVVALRPRYDERNRCGECHRRSPRYDRGEGRRRWRAMDLGTVRLYVEGAARRVRCREHGVVVAAVPWARHDARFTRDFDDQAAWMTTHTDRSTVCKLLRISWPTIGRIIARVGNEARRRTDLLAGLRRIGIDEISFRKGHRYLTVVVDHDSGRLVWAREGRNDDTVRAFFDELGTERAKAIELVSADGGAWIHRVVKERCPSATICLDPFHVVKWAGDALDEVRREVWNQARRSGNKRLALDLKRSRYALWKAPENLTERQTEKLATIQRTNAPLYRAYLLKEQLRQVFRHKGYAATDLLHDWLAWASRSKLRPFVELARKIRRHLEPTVAVLLFGLTNARIESVNTKIRLLHRLAFGFHTAGAMIALAMLRLSGICPPLPGR